MTDSDTPKDGDFASYLERKQMQSTAGVAIAKPNEATPVDENDTPLVSKPVRQTINDVLVNGEEPTDAFLEELSALENAPELSDEDFEKQALEHPGADGDPRTPE